jgi:hypothetical protein
MDVTLGILQKPWPKTPDERQQMHIDAIRRAAELLRSAMHAAEGSNPPGDQEEHIWMSRRMATSATQLEIAEMFAVKAALE